MKTVKYFMGALALCAIALVSCEKTEDNGGGGVIIEPEVSEQPEIEAVPGAYVLVCQFEQAPCNDVILAGNYQTVDGQISNWSADPAAKFEPIANYPGWYQVTIKSTTDTAVVAMGKPIQLKEDGSFSWDHQWARNSVELLDGICTMTDENGGEIRIDMTEESTVVYVKSTGWATNPCAAAIPAGNHEWIVQLSDTCQAVPDDAQVIFTGNFETESWGDSKRVMTKDGNVWKWTGDYPENFQAKAICVTADGKQHWANGENYVFDGENYVYVVPSWQEL